MPSFSGTATKHLLFLGPHGLQALTYGKKVLPSFTLLRSSARVLPPRSALLGAMSSSREPPAADDALIDALQRRLKDDGVVARSVGTNLLAAAIALARDETLSMAAACNSVTPPVPKGDARTCVKKYRNHGERLYVRRRRFARGVHAATCSR